MTRRDGGGSEGDRTLDMRVGHHELVIRRRYEVASIANDLLIGGWFLLGSVFFLSESLVPVGTWFFILGSAELLLRPVIRLRRNLHLKRISSVPSGALMGTSHDF